ncbi:PIN domain-containing protein [Kocuria sp. ChxB]|uniref:PIN domain-containing protein n=1 Tax=Kocuria sp. ChxB TaxID=3035474 RepID=UPI0027A8BC99|nr:PIN domain-containing protein [Kocuria sp. ChxB]
MRPHLLDANVVIALVVTEHEHHHQARTWFQDQDQERLLLCSVVEGALVRMLLRLGERGEAVEQVLVALHDHQRIDFLADSPSYLGVPLGTLTGHRQVTDEYLVMLASHAGARLATFDRALSVRYPEQVTALA